MGLSTRTNVVIGLIATLALPAYSSSSVIFDVPGSTLTFPAQINNNGDIAGYYYAADTFTHGFLRNANGSFTTFDVPGAVNTSAASINIHGDITGYWDESGGRTHGYVRFANGTITPFDFPGSSGTYGASINDTGTIIGGYTDQNGQTHGFALTNGGTMFTIDPPGSTYTAAVQVNANGDISGYYILRNGAQTITRPFLRTSDGAYVTINTPDTFAQGFGINDLQQITGPMYARSNGQRQTGFLWSGGNAVEFKVQGSSNTLPLAINNPGEITGFYTTRSGTIGFVRASGGQITTFDIAGGNFTEGRSINASGVITGVTAATDPFVDTKGFLRFP
jgi:probable HAF family extracellular repeat protein